MAVSHFPPLFLSKRMWEKGKTETHSQTGGNQMAQEFAEARQEYLRLLAQENEEMAKLAEKATAAMARTCETDRTPLTVNGVECLPMTTRNKMVGLSASLNIPTFCKDLGAEYVFE